MEEVEAGLLEGGIGWLAETILENLDTDKLDAWIRQVGLADDTEKLRAEIERVEGVVAAVKGRAIGNKPLLRSLGRVREVLYDADDAVDELDYYRLQLQVQGELHGTSTKIRLEMERSTKKMDRLTMLMYRGVAAQEKDGPRHGITLLP